MGFHADLDILGDAICSAMASQGVRSTRFTVAFDSPGPRSFSVWLVVGSDRERDALAADNDLASGVADLVTGTVPALGAAFRGVTVQSEETVARDFEGSWFYAMR